MKALGTSGSRASRVSVVSPRSWTDRYKGDSLLQSWSYIKMLRGQTVQKVWGHRKDNLTRRIVADKTRTVPAPRAEVKGHSLGGQKWIGRGKPARK